MRSRRGPVIRRRGPGRAGSGRDRHQGVHPMEQNELILRVSVSEVDGTGAERLVLFAHLRAGASGPGAGRPELLIMCRDDSGCPPPWITKSAIAAGDAARLVTLLQEAGFAERKPRVTPERGQAAADSASPSRSFSTGGLAAEPRAREQGILRAGRPVRARGARAARGPGGGRRPAGGARDPGKRDGPGDPRRRWRAQSPRRSRSALDGPQVTIRRPADDFLAPARDDPLAADEECAVDPVERAADRGSPRCGGSACR